MIEFEGQKSQRAGISGTVATIAQDVPTYTGEYTVTPKVEEETILQTKGRKMIKDVKVLKIPTYEVSNPQGGETLIIGDEYYGI